MEHDKQLPETSSMAVIPSSIPGDIAETPSTFFEALQKPGQDTMNQGVLKAFSAWCKSFQNSLVDDDVKVKLEEAETEDETNVQVQARIVLRDVRSALNGFRDNVWEGIVRARNHLMCLIALVGLVTHGMLCLVILSFNADNGRLIIIGATAYYMIGAISGLFGRLYRELTGLTTINDYNLSLVRLLAVPILSGLAGVGGVLVTMLLYSTLLESLFTRSMPVLSVETIQNIFHLNIPYYLLVAALFGLTPIIKGLQQKTDQFLSLIQTSKSSI